MGIYINEYLCYGKKCTEHYENLPNEKIYKDFNGNDILTSDKIVFPYFKLYNLEILTNDIYGKHLDLNVIRALYKTVDKILESKEGYDFYYINDCFLSLDFSREFKIIKCVEYTLEQSKLRLEKVERMVQRIEILETLYQKANQLESEIKLKKETLYNINREIDDFI